MVCIRRPRVSPIHDSPRARAWRLWPLLAVLMLSFGCNTKAVSPEDAAETFFRHINRGNSDAIWASLTSDSQRRLTDRHELVRVPTGADASPRAILGSLSLFPLGQHGTPTVVSPLGDRVTVRLSGPRGNTDLYLVREGPDWKVDLWRVLSLGDENAQGQ